MGIGENAYLLLLVVLAWAEIYTLMTIAKTVRARRERSRELTSELQATISRRLDLQQALQSEAQ